MSAHYSEVVKEWADRISKKANSYSLSDQMGNIPFQVLTVKDCIPDDRSLCIRDKLVAIRPEILTPEARRSENQLVYVTGGNGAEANSRGQAVFCNNLLTGEHERFERYQVMGEIKPECLPEWAKSKLLDNEMSEDSEMEE